MKHIFLTLYPSALEPYLQSFPFARLKSAGLAEFELIHMRGYGLGPHHSLDDKPYGGGEGMVLRPEPLAAAVEDLRSREKELKVILPSARGLAWTDQAARQEAGFQGSTLFICGRFSGVDQRFVDLFVDQEVCIGPYVLAGGELPALVISESIIRHVKGSLGREESAEKESFSQAFNGLCEYPLFTRPEEFRGRRVPDDLLSGDHRRIENWRKLHLGRLPPHKP